MHVNTAKLLSRGKIRKLPEFKFGPNKLAIVDKEFILTIMIYFLKLSDIHMISKPEQCYV